MCVCFVLVHNAHICWNRKACKFSPILKSICKSTHIFTGHRPDIAKQLGFKGAKIPLPFGPAEGERGLAENCARVEDVRAAVGPEFPLMLDCYMSLVRSSLHHPVTHPKLVMENEFDKEG